MSKKFYVLASLHDESNFGWVWLPESSSKEYNSRDLVKIEAEKTGKKIYTICRIIDDNFIRIYHNRLKKDCGNDRDNNKSDKDYNCDENECNKITGNGYNIVISDYYRAKLGIDKGENSLIFTKVSNSNIFAKVKYLLEHPDNAIQIAAFLAIASILISSIGILLSLIFSKINIIVNF